MVAQRTRGSSIQEQQTSWKFVELKQLQSTDETVALRKVSVLAALLLAFHPATGRQNHLAFRLCASIRWNLPISTSANDCQLARRCAPQQCVKEDLSFESYYTKQGIVDSADEFQLLLSTLEQPLPLDVRFSRRAALAKRAFTRLCHLQRVNNTSQDYGRQLYWLSSSSDADFSIAGGDVWQWPQCKPSARQFLERQRMRGTLQRQESASMLPPLLLSLSPSHLVLDMCAAPGSKSIQILSLMEAAGAEGESGCVSSTSSTGLLIANDNSRDRAITLSQRLASVNVASPLAVVTSFDGMSFPDFSRLQFDRVLCDVPCSGDGMFRKKSKKRKNRWSTARAERLHRIQLRLLQQGLLRLRTGGMLVYSTCSFNPLENEAVVASVLRSMPNRTDFLLEDPRDTHSHLFRNSESDGGLHAAQGLTTWHVPEGAPETMRPPSSMAGQDEASWLKPLLKRCVRLLPHRDDCGGFFVAVFRRIRDITEETRNSEDVLGQELQEQAIPVRQPQTRQRNRTLGNSGCKHVTRNDSVPQPLAPSSITWSEIVDFYGLKSPTALHVFWRPPSQPNVSWPGKNEKLYLVTEGVARFMSEHWTSDLGEHCLYNVGVKAFAWMHLDNLRHRACYTCHWRPCQEALSLLLPLMTKRRLWTSDEAFFAKVLRERQLPREEFPMLMGLETCLDASGDVNVGGAVLSLVDISREGGAERSPDVSVVIVIRPGSLEVFAPKEEVVGLLELLDGGEH